MKNVKTIAEYAIRKWMEQEGLVEECFKLTVRRKHIEARL